MKPSTTWRFLALLFALFLLCIILAANLGIGRRTLGLVYNFPYGDKIAHFLLFGVLSLLAGLSFSTRRVRLLDIPLLKSSLVIAALITLEEILQIPLARRDFDLIDLTAGLAGVFLFGELGARLYTVLHGARG